MRKMVTSRRIPLAECGMARLTPPSSQKYLLPHAADAVGPQNEAERRLYELIVEGLNSGEARGLKSSLPSSAPACKTANAKPWRCA